MLALIALPLAPRAPEALQPGGFTADDLEAARARRLLEERIGLPPSALVIVIRATGELRAGDPRVRGGRGRRHRARPPARTTSPASCPTPSPPHQVSADGRTVYEVVTLDLPPDRSPDALEPAARPRSTRSPGLDDRASPAVRRSTATSSGCPRRTSGAASCISLPLAALALLLVFGSVVAAGVPVVVGGVAVLVALARDRRASPRSRP